MHGRTLVIPVTVLIMSTDAALAFSFIRIILKLAAETPVKVDIMLLLGTRIVSVAFGSNKHLNY